MIFRLLARQTGLVGCMFIYRLCTCLSNFFAQHRQSTPILCLMFTEVANASFHSLKTHDDWVVTNGNWLPSLFQEARLQWRFYK